MSQYARYSGLGGGGGSGVSSINGETGAITILPGANISVTNLGSSITIAGQPGTVTSVGLADGSTAPIYSISGSPVTSSGTLTFTLNSQTANKVFAGPSTGSAAQPTFRSLVSADIPSLSSIYVPQTEVGAANGVASLDGSGKVPVAQLPSAVFIYQGTWNPSTNTPTLIDGTGTTGYVYWVSAAYAGPVAGLSNPSMINFQIGDLVLYNGTQWELTTPAAGVVSVNGLTGAVIVNAINQLTGDVDAGPASGSQSEVATIQPNVVTNAKLATMPTLTLKGNNTGSTGNALDLTVAQVNAILPIFTSTLNGSVPLSGGGTVNYLRADGTWDAPPGATSGTVTSVALTDSTGLFNITGSPVTSSGTLTLASFQSQSANTFFAAPNGSNGAPTFRAIVPADVPTLNQNTTGTAANITATSNSTLTTLSSLSLPISQLGAIPSNTIVGNNTGGSAAPTALTTAQVNAILPVFTSTLNGLTPASGGGTTNYLRADGTWDAPPGGSSYTFADSLVNTGGTVTLVNDTATPAASSYYGTNASSVLGYYPLPSAHGNTNLVESASSGVIGINGNQNLLTLTITTTGGPVQLGLISDSSGNNSSYTIINSNVSCVFNFLNNSTVISTQFTSMANANLALPPTIFGFIDNTVAGIPGTYTYVFQVLTPTAGSPVSSLNYAKMYALELSNSGAVGSGTVTSVAFTDASTAPIYSISGSPVTTSGTLTQTLNTQSANTVFAGPSSGSAVQPTFRSLVAADLPIFTSSLAGAVPASGGGTSNYLRADGTWDTPAGGGGGTYEFIGNASISGTSWSYSSTTLSLPTSGTSTSPTVLFNPGTGTIQTTSVTSPSFTVNGLSSGYYKIIMTFVANNGGNDTFAIFDGTTLTGFIGVTSFTNATCVGFYNYSGTNNITFSLYASSSGAGSIFGNAPSGQHTWQVNFSIEKVG